MADKGIAYIPKITNHVINYPLVWDDDRNGLLEQIPLDIRVDFYQMEFQPWVFMLGIYRNLSGTFWDVKYPHKLWVEKKFYHHSFYCNSTNGENPFGFPNVFTQGLRIYLDDNYFASLNLPSNPTDNQIDAAMAPVVCRVDYTVKNMNNGAETIDSWEITIKASQVYRYSFSYAYCHMFRAIARNLENDDNSSYYPPLAYRLDWTCPDPRFIVQKIT